MKIATRFKYSELFIALPGLGTLFSSSLAIDTGLYPRYLVLAFSFMPYILSKKTRIGFSFHPSDIAILSFLALGIVGSLRSVNISEASTWLIRPCFWMSAFYIFKQLTRKEKKIFLYSLLLSGTILIGYSLWQLGHTDFSRVSSYQVTGFNGHKNLLVSALLLLAGISLIAVYKNGLNKKLLWFAAIALFLTLSLFSKTGVIGSLVLIIGWFTAEFFLKNESRNLPIRPLLGSFILTFLFIPAFFLILPLLIDLPITMQLDSERCLLWQKSFALIVEHPILGIGVGNWHLLFPSHSLSGIYRLTDLNISFQRPHNDLLLILCETGVLGFFFFLLTPFYACLQTIKYGWNKANLIYLVLMIVVFLILFSDFPLERPEHGLMLMYILSAPFSVEEGQNKTLPAIGVYVLLFYIMLVSLFRMKGEYYTKQMNDAIIAKKNHEVIRNGNCSLNIFYSLDPWSNPIHWQMGRAWMALHQSDSAYRHFRIALNAAPFHHHLINDMGVMLFTRRQVIQAQQMFKEALRINPRFDEPALNLARIELLSGNLLGARQTLDTMKHDSPERSALLSQLMKK